MTCAGKLINHHINYNYNSFMKLATGRYMFAVSIRLSFATPLIQKMVTEWIQRPSKERLLKILSVRWEIDIVACDTRNARDY